VSSLGFDFIPGMIEPSPERAELADLVPEKHFFFSFFFFYLFPLLKAQVWEEGGTPLLHQVSTKHLFAFERVLFLKFAEAILFKSPLSNYRQKAALNLYLIFFFFFLGIFITL
jgi:hypothetical protein